MAENGGKGGGEGGAYLDKAKIFPGGAIKLPFHRTENQGISFAKWKANRGKS